MFNYSVLAASLREAGYDGSFNDSLYQYFATTYGITTGQLNELLYYHLGQLGYTGSLSDRLNLWDGTLFSISQLFAAGEQGAWFDPSDLASMFQDSAGTTPAVVGQPVGLMLDKHLGLVLGPELVSNPGPAFVATTGWTAWRGAALSVVGGELRVTNVDAYGGAYQALTTVVGATYKFVVSVTDPTNLFYIYIASAGPETGIFINQSNNSAGTYTINFVAVSTTTYVTVGNQQITVGHTMDLVSATVKLLPGNHAKQATAAARPTLSARVNLLTYSEQMDNAVWNPAGPVGITVNSGTAPDGTMTANHLVPTVGVTYGGVTMSLPILTVGSSYTQTIYAKAGAYPRLGVRFWSGSNYLWHTTIDLTTGLVVSGSEAGFISSVSAGEGWWKITVSGVANSTGDHIAIEAHNAATTCQQTFTADGVSGIYIWHPQLENSPSATRYQRIAAATDYDTVGFPTRLTLDKVDDLMSMTVPTGGFVGTMVLSTTQGTAAYGVNIPAGSYSIGGLYHPGPDIVGELYRHGALTDAEIANVSAYMVSKGGGPAGAGAYAGVTSFANYWRGMNRITSFPLVNSSLVTSFLAAWYECTSLTSFPLINTSSVTSFYLAWYDCHGLTSFPLINTTAGTNFESAWNRCSSLTSFPQLNFSAGTIFLNTWYMCSSLSNFPANMFDTCMATNFTNAFFTCALTQTSVDNILISINTANTSNGTLNMTGGTSATPSSAGLAAKAAMVARGWTITHN